MNHTHDVSLLLSGQAVAQCSWYYSTTAPVRNWWTDVRYGSQEMQRASDEVQLHQRRVALERNRSQLAREYAAYNSEVSAYDYYTNIDRGSQNTGLYLSESTPSYGVGESPNVRYMPVPVPVPIPVQQYQTMQSQQQPFQPAQQVYKLAAQPA